MRAVLLAVLAIAAALLVAVPTQMTEPWRWIAPLWMYHAMIAMANTAAWGSCLLALVLAIRRSRDDAAFSLGLFLTLASGCYGLWSARYAINAIDPLWLARAAYAAQYSGALFAAISLTRFASLFPRRFTAGDLRPILQQTVADSEAFEMADSWGAAERWVNKLFSRLFRRYRAHVERSKKQHVMSPERAIALHAWILESRKAFGACIVLAIIVSALCLAGWTTAAMAIAVYPMLLIGMMGLLYLRLNYRLSNAEERRRGLWVVEGFLLALAPGFVTEFAMLPLILINVPVVALFMGAYVLAMSAGAIGLVVCLAIATFHSGSFDSSLVIRRTTVYSAVIVLLTSVFAVVENLVTNAIAARTALPSNLGAIIAAVAVALAFGPVRDKLKKIVDRRVPAP